MTELTDTLDSLQAALLSASTLAAKATLLAGATGPSGPTGPAGTIPAGANTVRVNGKTYALAGVNPTAASNPAGAAYPGFRGPDQLIAVQAPLLASGCNQFGTEVPVSGGAAGTPIVSPATGGIAVPSGGYVLSGHGLAATFLGGVKAGMAIELLTVAGPTGPTGPTGSTGPVVTGAKSLGVYLMDGVGHTAQVPAKCNRILVAFYQGTDLVEWGGDSPSTTATALSAWRASRAGNQVLISLGGAGGAVNLDQVDEGLARINGHFPVDGIDFDAESFSYSPAQAVSISRLCATAIGRAPKDFIVSFVPPGGNPVSAALDAAKAVQAAGFTVNFGQQLYETSISDSDVINATGRAVAVLGAKSVLVGMMLGDSHNSWTVSSAESRMRQVVAKWPDIAGAYLWESSRAGTADWASKVGTVLGL